MIKLIIDDYTYSIPTEITELNLSNAIKARRVIDKYIGRKDQKIHNLNFSDDIGFCHDLLSALSIVPKAQIEKVTKQEMSRLTKNYLLPIICKLIYSSYIDIYPKNESFECNGETLFYPSTEYDLSGETLELAEISAQEFCEACDLMNTDRLLYAPRITATLCRPQNERYNSHIASRRADKMLFLNMGIIANVLGMLNRTLLYIDKEFGTAKTSNADTMAIPTSNNHTTDWCELLLMTASCRPTEVEACKKMNLYDFMQLACFKQKTLITN